MRSVVSNTIYLFKQNYNIFCKSFVNLLSVADIRKCNSTDRGSSWGSGCYIHGILLQTENEETE